MKIAEINTQPFTDQKPGTSGLRKKTSEFRAAHYLENFIQSIFNALSDTDFTDKVLVVGGDGRFFNRQAIEIIIKMALAAGFKEIMVAKGGLLSTPAMSCVIRKYGTLGGIILSASHNPGGENGDFGVKYNMSNGGPAPEKVTEAIFAASKVLDKYRIAEIPDFDIDTLGTTEIDGQKVTVFDGIKDYAELMEELFDFEELKDLFKSGFTMRYDALHAVTGPYAVYILEDMLGATKGTVVNALPLPDFGGGHPDPNLTYAKELVDVMFSPSAPDFGAASDGDGDRNMILGNNCYVNPSDSLALIAANYKAAKGYKAGLLGIARSMPTSGAVDKVAAKMNLDCYETPTGWKFFGNLMDANKVTLCGEESFGTGSSHVREKDGLWAVLFWLSIIAYKKKTVKEILFSHWEEYGRNYYSRYDYENIDSASANEMMDKLKAKLPELQGTRFGNMEISFADNFSYNDPIDNSVSSNQGIRIIFSDSSRIIFRLSGTGTGGATLRIYFESYKSNPQDHHLETSKVLRELIEIAENIASVTKYTGKEKPDVIT